MFILHNDCCDGLYQGFPKGFSSHQCSQCNEMLQLCPKCNKFCKVVISGDNNSTFHKCAVCLVQCKCKFLSVVPQNGYKSICNREGCDTHIVHCNCDVIQFESFSNIAEWTCKCGMKCANDNL